MFEGNPTRELASDARGWNIAEGYTSLKILKPLVEMDKLVRIAIYGCENIEDSIMINQNPPYKTMMRIEALQRLVDTIQEVFENAEFGVRKGLSPETLATLQKRTNAVAEVLPAISKQTFDARNNSNNTLINEEHFNRCLNELRAIKKEIPKPLNENSMIFPSSDETNLEQIKEQIIEGG